MSSLALTAAERERVDAVDRLVARGAPGVAELVALMSDPSWTVRRAVVAGLAALGDDAVAPLAAWLRTVRTDEHAIAAAVDALSSSVGASATPACIALLDDALAAVASDAAQVLGRRAAVAAVPMLARAIAHTDDNVAVAAIEALGAIGGTGALEPLVAVLGQRSFFRTFPALQVLARLGDPRAVAPIAALLADETYRFEAARALGRAGFAQAIVPLASLLVGAGDAVVRLVALALSDLLERARSTGALDHVVATMRTHIGPVLRRFVAVLRHADPIERTAIAVVLGRLGDESAIPDLVRLLDDPGARATAVAAIQWISRDREEVLLATLGAAHPAARAAVLPGIRTARAAPLLRQLLDDGDPEVRARACEALARVGDTAAIGQLFAALGDPSPRVGHAAAAAIHALGDPETAPRTIAVLREGPPAARRHALRLVASMGFDHAFDAVAQAVTDPDPLIAELAVAAFARLGDLRVEITLDTLARDPREGVRGAAMRAVAQRGAPSAAALLGVGLRDDAAWVRYYAAQGLGRLGDVGAVALVIERLADAVPFVRIAAIEALGHLDTPASWQALASVVRSVEPDEHRAALASMALGRDARALPYLLGGVSSHDLATQLIALSGLAQRPEATALDALTGAAGGAAGDVRDAALALLGARDDQAAAVAVVALALATPLAHPVQQLLSRAGAARLAAIVAGLPGADAAAAMRLVGALARLGDVAALAAALVQSNPEVRRAAARALVAFGDAAALGRVADDDPDLEVRRISREPRMTPEIFAIFSQLVEEVCGLHYGETDHALFGSKVAAHAESRGHDALLDYYYRLRYDDPTGVEMGALVEALLVHETYFFRELPPLVELVESCLVPAVAARGRARVWSAACSTGEEPYTLAMLLAEQGLLDRVEIVATDISPVTVAAARLGRHAQRSLRDNRVPRLVDRYLDVDARGVAVAPRIREAVRFATLNLVDPDAHLALGMFDAVLCRNVLIYFTETEILRVIARLASHLRPGGLLAVGVAESLLRFGTTLVCEERGHAFFYRAAA